MKLDIIFDVMFTTFITLFSINDLQSVISISMLVIQCVYIVFRFLIKLYEYLVHKKGNIKEDVKEVIDSIEDLTDNGKLDNSNKEGIKEDDETTK